MQKILFFIISITFLINFIRDVFEEDMETPMVLFVIELADGEGESDVRSGRVKSCYI